MVNLKLDKLNIYPEYAFHIIIYTMCFIPVAVSSGKFLHKLFPKYNKKKDKLTIYGEAMIQIMLTAVISYFFREFIDYFLKHIININMYGNPSKYASLVIAPIMFGSQPDLIKKIRFIWDISGTSDNTLHKHN